MPITSQTPQGEWQIRNINVGNFHRNWTWILNSNLTHGSLQGERVDLSAYNFTVGNRNEPETPQQPEPETPTQPETSTPSTIWNGVDLSPVFNVDFYRNNHSDLRNMTDEEAFNHFTRFGMQEGRQAHADFNVRAYRHHYADLNAAFGDDLPSYYVHFARFGQAEGRNGNPEEEATVFAPIWNGQDMSAVFDVDFYQNRYSDLRHLTAEQAFAHFTTHGMREARQAHANFDVNAYRNRYADLRNAFGSDLQKFYLHFVNFGQSEGRNGKADTPNFRPIWNGYDLSPVFDVEFYRNRYHDLRHLTAEQAFDHFTRFGMQEGRVAHPDFDVRAYQNRYADLNEAFGDDLPSYYLHFVKFGHAEGRNARP